MSEQQLETHAIMSIVIIGLLVCGFLVAFILSLRSKRIRDTDVNTIKNEILNPEKRKNGKH